MTLVIVRILDVGRKKKKGKNDYWGDIRDRCGRNFIEKILLDFDTITFEHICH